MDIRVREYRDSDWDEMVAMTRSIVDLMSVIDPHKRFRPKEKFDAEKEVKLFIQKTKESEGRIFILEVDGSIAGYGIASVVKFEEHDFVNKFPTKQGYIDTFFIKEEYRGKGVADTLMNALEKYFRSIGCEFSSVACVAANDAARNFYAKMGYGEQYIDFLKKL